MLISTLTHTRFLRLQEAFYQEATRSPVKCTLIITGISADNSDPYDAFVGSQKREDKEYLVPCLYSRDFDSYTREKYGIPRDSSGTVYLSPKDLQTIVGYWRLDRLKIRVIIQGEELLIDRTHFLGELYGSCIAVELRLKTAKKGG